MKVEFYLCNICKNVTELIYNGGGELVCCGEPMIKLEEHTADAATEKHVPVAEVTKDQTVVTVGSEPHPMTEEHYIMWIAVVTKDGIFRKHLQPHEKPEALFPNLTDVVAYYEYCNIHGLWKLEA
ncbi:MAG: desulfoferrodoxin family protein [Sphaerochaetaceae bacterium]